MERGNHDAIDAYSLLRQAVTRNRPAHPTTSHRQTFDSGRGHGYATGTQSAGAGASDAASAGEKDHRNLPPAGRCVDRQTGAHRFGRWKKAADPKGPALIHIQVIRMNGRGCECGRWRAPR